VNSKSQLFNYSVPFTSLVNFTGKDSQSVEYGFESATTGGER